MTAGRMIFLGWAAVACRDNPLAGTQIGFEDGLFCIEVARQPLAYDEVALSGLSPADVVDASVGTTTSTMAWGSTEPEPRSTSPLTLTLTYEGGAATFVDLEPDPDEGRSTTLTSAMCDDQVEVELRTVLTTDDGQLDEDWTVPLRGVLHGGPGSADAAEFYAEVPLDAVRGTFDAATYAEDLAGDGLDAVLTFYVQAGVSHGSVHALGEHPAGGGEESLSIATWGPPGDEETAR